MCRQGFSSPMQTIFGFGNIPKAIHIYLYIPHNEEVSEEKKNNTQPMFNKISLKYYFKIVFDFDRFCFRMTSCRFI